MIGDNLLRYNDDQLYLCPDFETSSLNLLMGNYPWQVAWVTYNNKGIISKENYYINWGNKLRMSKGAADVTGFDQRVIDQEGQKPEDVYKIFNNLLRDPKYIKTAHNWFGFDSMIEKIWAEELGYKHDYDYLQTMFDTNCLAKAIKKGFKAETDNLYAWQIKLCNFLEKGLKSSLGLLAKEYSLEYNPARLHKADEDVYVNAQLFLKQIWQLEI